MTPTCAAFEMRESGLLITPFAGVPNEPLAGSTQTRKMSVAQHLVIVASIFCRLEQVLEGELILPHGPRRVDDAKCGWIARIGAG